MAARLGRRTSKILRGSLANDEATLAAVRCDSNYARDPFRPPDASPPMHPQSLLKLLLADARASEDPTKLPGPLHWCPTLQSIDAASARMQRQQNNV